MLHPDLPDIVRMLPLIDSLLHLPAEYQNIIMNDASHILRQEIQEFIGSLLAAHSRQTQIWTNFNEAAAEKHGSEIKHETAIKSRDHTIGVCCSVSTEPQRL